MKNLRLAFLVFTLGAIVLTGLSACSNLEAKSRVSPPGACIGAAIGSYLACVEVG